MEEGAPPFADETQPENTRPAGGRPENGGEHGSGPAASGTDRAEHLSARAKAAGHGRAAPVRHDDARGDEHQEPDVASDGPQAGRPADDGDATAGGADGGADRRADSGADDSTDDGSGDSSGDNAANNAANNAGDHHADDSAEDGAQDAGDHGGTDGAGPGGSEPGHGGGQPDERPHPESDAVLVVEPLLPQRLRRPSDALRFFATLLSLAGVILLAMIAKQTLNGLEADVTEGTSRAPGFLTGTAGFIGGAAVLAVPTGFAIERVFHRDGLRVAEGLIAAIAGLLVSFGVGEWLVASAPGDLYQLFTGGRSSVEPLNTLLTSVIAYITAVRINRRQTWRAMMWTAIAIDVFALFTGAAATALGVTVTILVGMAVGYATLYGIGSPNTRPPGSAAMAVLRRLGFPVTGARRIEDDVMGSRRYLVNLRDGDHLDVTMLDRDRQVAGMLYRLWRRIRLSTETHRRAIRSLRAELEREALMAYATQAAGAGVPRLVGTAEVGTDAALLAYEHVESRPLEDVPDSELDDDVLTRIWEQVHLLHSHRLAHRHLTGESIHIAANGDILLQDVRTGEIAAGDLVLRLDIAQLLAYLGLRVGPQRSVASAAAVLGADAVGGALPLLQRIALARGTRAAVGRTKELLPALRAEIVSLKPQIAVQEVRLERFRPRTLVTIIASAAAAYVLLSQLSRVSIGQLLGTAEWGWAAVALGAAGLSYVAAALALVGFVPERLPFGRAVLAQFAGSFVKLVAPAAVGAVAINTRFLQKRGIRPGAAVASVGASQVVVLTFHIMLLLFFAYVTGTEAAPSLTPSRGLVIALLAGAVVILIVLAIAPLRRLITKRLRGLFAGVIPRLLDVLQSPRKIAQGTIGTLMVTLTFIGCLNCCVLAFGGDLSFAAIAVVYLAGNAIGSAAPTPGGLGAVEASLSLGLTVAGLPGTVATSAVLLYRLLTFWLPVLPGWGSFTWLQRHDAL